jgi:nucleoid-associated protein YgaU
MPKDFKIGLLVGLVLVICAALFLSMHPSLSTRARIVSREKAEAERKRNDRSSIEPNRLDDTDIVSERETHEIEVTPRYHIVRDDETLAGISYQYYGTENKWQKILDANRDIIKDVKKLKPGSRLVIPD